MLEFISTYGGLQTVAGLENVTNFTSVESFLANAGSKGFSIVKNVGNISQTGKILEFTKAIEVVPELTGGAKLGVTAVDVAISEGGAVTASTVGTVSAVSVGAVVGGIIAGLGLGVTAFTVDPRFWTTVSNAIFGTDIPVEQFDNYNIRCLFKNGKTYVPAEIIENVANALLELGAYNTNKIIVRDVSNLSVGQIITRSKIQLTTDNVREVITDCVIKSFSLPTGTSYNSVLLVIDDLMNLMQTYNLNNYDMLYVKSLPSPTEEGSQSQLTVTIAKQTGENFTVGEKGIDYFGDDYAILYSPVTSIKTFYVSCQIYLGNIIKYCYLSSSVDVSGNFPFPVGHFLENNYLCSSNIGELIENSVIDGVKKQEGAQYPMINVPHGTSFPAWYYNMMQIHGINPDFLLDPNADPLAVARYLELLMTLNDPLTEGVTAPQSEAQTGDYPNPYPIDDPVVKGVPPIIQIIEYPPTPTTPSTPYLPPTDPTTPVRPSPVIPDNPPINANANGLMTVYNPTKTELNSFAGYLWSTNFIDQVLKLFANPMDCIIGLHIIYCIPTIAKRGNIIVGYLDSGVETNVIESQYVDVPCGSVSIAELYGDSTDYSPYTKIHVYLPFIGIVQVNANDAMASVMTVNYKVDILTGTCLASIKISKNDTDIVLYTYAGNCSVQLPLTGADTTRIFAGLAGLAVGVATGGATALIGAGVMASGKVAVQQSGNIGANAGAMGIKKPYVIINRTIPITAQNYNNYYGFPSNKTVKLSNLSGFIKVKQIILEGFTCFESERKEIETLLSNGVYI